MPATSPYQRIAAAIAEHAPDRLFKRNAGMLRMTHAQLHDIAVKTNYEPLKRALSRQRKGPA